MCVVSFTGTGFHKGDILSWLCEYRACTNLAQVCVSSLNHDKLYSTNYCAVREMRAISLQQGVTECVFVRVNKM